MSQIVAYLTGELSEPEMGAFETRLFAGEFDGVELTDLSELTMGLREAAFLGILSVAVSRSEMEQLRTLGYRIVELVMRPGETAFADLNQDFDLVFLEYMLDLDGVTRLDVEVCDEDGTVFKRVLEVPFSPEEPSVMGFCARELALAGIRQNPNGMVTRFVSVEATGDRVLGEYRGKPLHPLP